MAKIGDGVPRLIDKAVDFMASSQAFMEYLKKSPRLQHVPRDIPQDKEALFLQRLEYYRQLYRGSIVTVKIKFAQRFSVSGETFSQHGFHAHNIARVATFFYVVIFQGSVGQ